MKTELVVILVAAILLSAFGIYKQRSMVKSIGIIEFRWQTKVSKIRFFIMMIIYVVVFGIVLYRTIEPLIIFAFIALLPIYLYRPLGYEYIGQDGILVRNGGLRLYWHQVTSWSIVENEGRAFLRLEFKQDPSASHTDLTEIVIPSGRRSEIEMAMQKGAVIQS
ncbi:MAG: hypothetical protein ABSB78_07165 [Bacteroidota bacterium]